MFKLNLKIALRNLWRNKTSSVINIIGLAVGLSACVLLLLYVNYEMKFDHQFKDADKIYQVMTNFQDASGKITNTGGIPGDGIAMAIKNKIPEIDVITRIGGGDASLIATKQKGFKKTDRFADPEILKVFNYEFIAGDPDSALKTPNSIILTEETAKLLFGRTDVINETIRYQNQRDLKVTGVIKDLPTNTSVRFDYLMPWSFYESTNDYVKNPTWGNFNFLTIARVNNPANIDLINAKVKKLFNENYTEQMNQNFLFPLSDLHLHGKFELFKEQVLKTGAITAVNQSHQSITRVSNWFYGLKWPGMEEKGKEIVFNRLQTQYDFVKTSGLELVSGRDFSREFASDTAGILLSSTAVKMMKFKDPIGKIVDLFGDKLKVIGIFKDFIWDSPYHSGRQMVITFNKNEGGNIHLRLNSDNSLSKNMELISTVVKNINPEYPVEIRLINDLYSKKLQSEKILGILVNLFGGIAILISCMGLYGLVAYSAEQRTKEFGVRRVLGASVGNIMNLLSLSFLKMVFVAACIGVPLAYYMMNRWLTNFEFRTTISLSIVLISIAGTAIIAFLTVSFQAYKAAKANPVEALKYE